MEGPSRVGHKSCAGLVQDAPSGHLLAQLKGAVGGSGSSGLAQACKGGDLVCRGWGGHRSVCCNSVLVSLAWQGVRVVEVKLIAGTGSVCWLTSMPGLLQELCVCAQACAWPAAYLQTSSEAICTDGCQGKHQLGAAIQGQISRAATQGSMQAYPGGQC